MKTFKAAWPIILAAFIITFLLALPNIYFNLLTVLTGG
jgi:hypothetical protein